MATDGPKVWIDGKLIEFEDATVHVLSNSNHRGSTVFDVMRIFQTDDGPAVFGLREHVARFVRSMTHMGMEWKGSIAQLESGIGETIAANPSSSIVKVMATWSEVGRSSVPDSLVPNVWIAVMGPEVRAAASVGKRPLKLKLAAGPKIPEEILPVSLKVAAMYTPGIREIIAARADGFDDVVFRGHDGALAEGSTRALAVVKNERLILPGLNQVLDGITRRAVLEVAQHLRIASEIRHVYWDEVASADELFVSSTTAPVLSVVQVDDQTFPAGPVTKRIADQVDSLLGGTHELSRRWLTPVASLSGQTPPN